MSRNLYVPLPEPARAALYELAEREWRHPKDQAAMLLTDALRRSGALVDDDQPPASAIERAS
jgi:hypothetical protein